MDSAKIGTFFLGLITAAVLFLLWRKEQRNGGYAPSFPASPFNGTAPAATGPTCSGGCSRAGAGSPAFAAGPGPQSQLASVGLDGQISPTTAPLNAVTGGDGTMSFYSNSGVTPDSSFTFVPVPDNAVNVGSPQQPGGLQGNVPGSATTPAAVTPVRANQPVPPYAENGFIPRYSFVGVYVH